MLKKKNVFLGYLNQFLGYHIDADEIHPFKTKVEAIQAAPYPKNKV